MDNRPPRVLTWHVHGSYLYYLTQARCEFYLPVRPDRAGGYGGRSPGIPWGLNVKEVPAEDVKDLALDGILFQSRHNYEVDQYEILSAAQRRLPRAYLEHDPPRENPTDTRHVLDDPEAVLVHCTHFNQLMWNNNRTPSTVIEHGVMVPDGVAYTGEYERGLVVINNLKHRGRRLGADLFERARREVPLDLVGLDAEALGGLGPIHGPDLPAFMARYRFFFNPIRYTSLGLAVCEAMMVGLPVVALATTELVTVIQDGLNGYLHTDLDTLIGRMRALLADPSLAASLGAQSRRTAGQRFNIRRFARDWETLFEYLRRRELPPGASVHILETHGLPHA